MRALNALRRLFSGKQPEQRSLSENEEQELERLRVRFRARHHNFKLLLSSNNEALEHISALEEMARGVHPFGMHAVRAKVSRVATQAYRTIKHLQNITPNSQGELLERFREIKAELDKSLAPRRSQASREAMPLVLPLDQVTKEHVELTGPKMARLGEARNVLHMDVPDGFVLTAAAFDAFMAASGLREEIDRRIQAKSEAMQSRMALAQELQKLILQSPVPDELAQAMETACKELTERLLYRPRLVVRSSALGEDATGASFAGQHRSAVNVSIDSLHRVYREILASAYSLEAISYRLNKGIPEESAAMCVGVLTMVEAKAGGVAYSRDPLGARGDSALIYSVHGLPKQMVDGTDAADFFALQRDSGAVLEHDIGFKRSRTVSLEEEGVRREQLAPELVETSSIDADTAKRIFDLVMALERHFGESQDMEWALDDFDDLYVLQARPLPAAINRGLAAHELDLMQLPREPSELASFDGEPDAFSAAGSDELGRGLAASPGVAAGPVHLLQREADMLMMPKGAVMVLKRPLPRFAPALAEAAAVVAEEGGLAGHLASVARELGKPAIFGMVDAIGRLPQGEEVTVDADAMIVLKGRDEARLQRTPPPGSLMKGSNVYGRLMEVLPLVAKLTLLDPQSDEFRARNCKSMHDILRYSHENALLTMFDFGKINPFPERAAQLVFGGKKSQFKIIDLGDSFHTKTQRNRINVEEVDSRPFQAFWRGMTAMPWEGPPAVHAKGMASILHEATLNRDLLLTQPSAYTTRNYFMVAKDFLSGQSRFGFHFSTVESLIGERERENYVSFQFKGGAADKRRREKRAIMIASLLDELGFETQRTIDSLRARLDNRRAETIETALATLGFLTMHTRQLDMVMQSESAALSYKEKLLDQLGRFVT